MPATPVLILAAGRGNRLAPLTDDLPKCLLPVCGASPLERMLGALGSLPVAEVVLVVGHGRDRVAAFLAGRTLPYPVKEVFNPLFDEANNIYSIHLARESCPGGFLLVNSDVVCHPRILEIALAPPDESFLVVDPSLPPRAEAMKVRYEGQRLVEIGKQLDLTTADGEYIGIARFDARGARAFFERTAAILESGGANEWYEAAIGEAASEVAFSLRSTEGLPWIEIDDPEDLRRAEREVVPLIPKTSAS